MQIRTRLLTFVVTAGVVATAWSCGGKTPTQVNTPQIAAPTAAVPGAGDDGTVTAAAGTTPMRWTLADRCPDGKGVQMRIFTRTGFEQKTFPEGGGTFKVQSGKRISKVIECRTGQKVCPGLTTMPETSRYWGVGINGGQKCTNCCKFCAPKEVYLETSCPKGQSVLISALDGGEVGGLSFLDGDAVDSE